MTRKQKSALFSVVGFVFSAILIFFVVSLCLSSANDRSLIDEWNSWTDTENVEIVEDETDEEITDEETEDIESEEDNITTLSNITTDIEDYSNIEIVA